LKLLILEIIITYKVGL